MKQRTEVETKSVNPSLTPGDQVTLTAPNGLVTDYLVEFTSEGEGALIVKQPVRRKSEVRSVVVLPHLIIGNLKLSPGDKVTVIGPRGKKIPFKVSLLLQNKALILVPPNAPTKLSFIDKLRLFWAKSQPRSDFANGQGKVKVTSR